jgi:arylsulfatase
MCDWTCGRREFLKGALAGAALGPLAWAARTVRAAAGDPPARKPNIVLILADDMGYSDLGCYGSEIPTPNLDRLASEGLRFSQFYNAARCCPTRASLLTGLYPHQAGVGQMSGNGGAPGYQGRLNDRCVTIAEVLKTAGYTTLMAGKWHVGDSRPHWPVDRGFDEYFGLLSGGSNYFRLDKNRKMALGDQPWTTRSEGFYMTDAFTDHALGFLDKHGRKDSPFFLYLAFTSPHWPLHAPPDEIAKHRGKYLEGPEPLRQRRYRRQLDMGLIDKRWPLSPQDTAALKWNALDDAKKRNMDLRMAVYAAQISRMDWNVGRVLEKLRELGAEDDTLVLFLSDNGGCHEGGPGGFDRGAKGAEPGTPDSFSSYGLSWANLSNTPFRRYKHWTHEGGAATPLIARWPEIVRKGGAIVHDVGHIVDIMATCADVAGAAYPAEFAGRPVTPLEGRSLRPILEGATRDPHAFLAWEHFGNRAIREGKWKLVAVSGAKVQWELYDLEADRTELNNLASAMPDKVAELSAKWEEWANRVQVYPRPKPKPKRKTAPKGKGKSAEAPKTETTPDGEEDE